jgi:hypothetical protein
LRIAHRNSLGNSRTILIGNFSFGIKSSERR